MRIVDLGTQVHPRQAQAVADGIRADVRAGREGAVLVYEPAACLTAGADATWEDLAAAREVAIPIDRTGSVAWLGPGVTVMACITRMPAGCTLRQWRRLLLDAVAGTIADLGGSVTGVGRSVVRIAVDGRSRVVAAVHADSIEGITCNGVAVNVMAVDGRIRSGASRPETALSEVLEPVPSAQELGAAFAAAVIAAVEERTRAGAA